MMNTTKAPLIIDFSPFYSGDASQKQRLIDNLRQACLEKGFFQLTGHGISSNLQYEMFAQSAEFFALSEDKKMKCDKNLTTYNHGYEHIRAQNFEIKGAGDLKEGFYFGRDPHLDHPSANKGTFGCVPNVYPDGVENPAHFRDIIDEFHVVILLLAQDVLQILVLALNLRPNKFEEFGQERLRRTTITALPTPTARRVRGRERHRRTH